MHPLGALLVSLGLTQVFPPEVDPQWRPPVRTADAPSCEGCHPDEARWLARSVHAQAASPGLLGQLPTSGPHVGASLACLLCHAPEANQQPWRPRAPGPAPSSASSPAERWTAALGAGLPVEPNPDFLPSAQHRGVSCAGCHWRAGAVLAAPGHPVSPRALAAHPVHPDPLLVQPAFCASCHQFGAASAVAGKPLENTWVELQRSFWGQAGATCQGCHLPSGEHRFQGIHSPDLVAASVQVAWDLIPGTARGSLVLTNEAVGHDFPTYATPRVELRVEALDARGRALGEPVEQQLGRRVRFVDGAWREDEDSRLPPGQSARLTFDLTRLHPARLRARVRVEPDFAYVPLYTQLLERGGLPDERRQDLERALARAQHSGYDLFQEEREVTPR